MQVLKKGFIISKGGNNVREKCTLITYPLSLVNKWLSKSLRSQQEESCTFNIEYRYLKHAFIKRSIIRSLKIYTFTVLNKILVGEIR